MAAKPRNPARVFRLSISPQMGQKKQNVPIARVIASGGLEGDAHCYSERPLSLLPYESFSKLSNSDLEIKPGDFAENITTIGLDFGILHVGSRLLLGKSLEIEIIQLGKKCHNSCEIRTQTGDCIMPREGLFARALSAGELKEGDTIRIIG